MSVALTVGLVVVTAVVAHELAHVAATRAVGHRIFEIQIGVGPDVRTRVGEVDLALGLLPLGGHVQTGAPSADGYRWRAAVIAGAGVVANLGLVVLGWGTGNDSMVGFNVVAVAANLWPGRRRTMGDGSSDGRVLLDLLRGDEDAIAEERSGWYSVHAMRAREDGDLGRAVAWLDEGCAEVGRTRALAAVGGVLAFEQRRFADVVSEYASLIDDDRVSVAGRAGFAADASWAASLSADPELQPFALPWAEFAARAGPRTPRRRVILALAQVDAGAPADALTTLGELDDVNAQAVRVIALAAAGDRAGAGARYEAHVVRAVAPDHPLARRARTAVGADPS